MKRRDDCHYDIIIVGAGIAGLQLAELLNQSKLNVLLIDHRHPIGNLINHIYGTPYEYVKKWNLEKYIVAKCKFGFYGTEQKAIRDIPKNPFTVVDVAPWAKSRKLKCDKKTRVEIVKLIRENGNVSLIDKHGKRYTCKIVVDCTGDRQLIAPMIGIKKSRGDFMDYACIFKRAQNVEMNEMFYFNDRMLLNCGGWYYPISKTKCLIGISEWTEQGKYLTKVEFEKRMTTFIQTFYPFKKYLKFEDKIEAIHKIGPVTQLHSSIAEDNYLACGDAAGAGTPFIGLGFYTALEMAKSAYDSITEAFEKKDYSKRILKKHQLRFHEEFGKWYKWSWVTRWIILRYVTNRELNILAKRMYIFSDDEYEDIILSRMKPSHLVKLIFGSPKLSWLLFKNAVIYHVMQPLGLMKLKTRPLVTH